MTANPAKTCHICGRDLSREKRLKDAEGRYYCEPCHAKAVRSVMPAVSVVDGPADNPSLMVTAGGAIPTMIGPFTIIRLLGQGGMGAVYEAVQDAPKRTVALKVIRPGLLNPKMLRRFGFEAEVLGKLQHPAIAAIYAAGTAETPMGTQPYFAMEFVAGERLTKYAQFHKLSVKE